VAASDWVATLAVSEGDLDIVCTLKALDEQKPPYTVREVAKGLRLALQAKAAKRK
jgi:hypothetical protein